MLKLPNSPKHLLYITQLSDLMIGSLMYIRVITLFLPQPFNFCFFMGGGLWQAIKKLKSGGTDTHCNLK